MRREQETKDAWKESGRKMEGLKIKKERKKRGTAGMRKKITARMCVREREREREAHPRSTRNGTAMEGGAGERKR